MATIPTLIVEDDPDIQALLGDFLKSYENWSFEVYKASNGRDALALAREHPPRLVLLDVNLDDQMTGYEVARHLRSYPATVGARIVMLSANNAPVDRHLGEKAGANDYLSKPIESRLLFATLQEVLGDTP